MRYLQTFYVLAEIFKKMVIILDKQILIFFIFKDFYSFTDPQKYFIFKQFSQ